MSISQNNNTPIITGIWKFFQKLRHNISHKDVAEYFEVSEKEVSLLKATKEYEISTKEHREWSQKYLKKAKKYLPLLRFLPFVRGVAVCNSVALGTSDKNSDIDLLIITAPNRIWTARIFCTFFLHFLGVRRHHQKVAGRFCLSFFVTQEAIDFENIALQPRDPYLAFWVSSLMPLFGRDVFQKIQKQNTDWIQKHTGITVRFDAGKCPRGDSKIRSVLEKICGKWFEHFIKGILKPRAEKKRTQLKDDSGTVISDTMLKFHNSDRRREFL